MSTILESVGVKNLVTYKKATLPLNKHRITVIRGRNNDRRSKNASNAAGKSLICSTIPTVRYGAPPTVAAKRSASMLHGKGSEIRIKLRVQDKPFELVQFQKGRSIGYDVVEGGKAKN